MSTLANIGPSAGSGATVAEVPAAMLPLAPRSGGMSSSDLAELVSAFSGVTARLQATHEQLTAEVAQLKGELAQVFAPLC